MVAIFTVGDMRVWSCRLGRRGLCHRNDGQRDEVKTENSVKLAFDSIKMGSGEPQGSGEIPVKISALSALCEASWDVFCVRTTCPLQNFEN